MVTGGAVILTSLAGVVVFKEKLSARQWIGVAGVFQKYHDQITENVECFNEWAEEKGL